MEDFQFEMINIFNKNFKCNDVRKILKLYKKDISLIQYFENINLKQEKYQHPLFKNYNYCLLCGQKQKSKYDYKNLINSHIELEEKNIGQYLINNNIKLREIKNKKEKIAKRRFINSYEKNMKNNFLTISQYGESDTDLYIFNEVEKPKKKFKEKRLRKLTSFDKKKKLLKSLSNEYKENSKKNLRKIYYDYNNIDHFITPGKNNLINNSSERKINIDDSTPSEKFKINLDEEVKTNINNDDKSLDKNNIIIDINENDSHDEKTKSTLKLNKYKNNQKEKNLIESSNINGTNNNSVVENDKDRSNINKSTDSNNLVHEEDKISNKRLNIFEETKKFFGFGLKISENKRRRSVNFEESNNNNEFARNQTTKLKQKNVQNYTEKNDNCSICLQEIKEKFTLICGDFFCRDCIRSTILNAIKAISNLDKLSCPTCDEHIEENTIKKLLTEEEFEKYHNLITKIEGLKNKDHIPCPYPDCPGWAEDKYSNNNLLCCKYDHIFCKKCLKIIDEERRENNNEHKCFENMTDEEERTLQFFKENKNFKKCPNCQSMVVREGGGCNNMTCTNIWCGYEFCWICNRKYDDLHYKNPLSMCFGLSEMNYEGKLAKYSRMRFFRCMLIFILIIFIILPVIIVAFSIFEACLYIIAFVLDGSAMKNIKLKSLFAHKLFYKLVYGFFISIGFAYIPLGYMSLVLFVVFAPLVCIFNKIREKNDDELE